MTHGGPPLSDIHLPARRARCGVCGSEYMHVSAIEAKLFDGADPIVEISYRASCDVCGDSASRTCSDVDLADLVWNYIECHDLSPQGR